jgi:cytochrome P450
VKLGKLMPLSIVPANSISWTLLELSRHPEMQSRLREEIRAKKRDMVSKGNTTGAFAAEDFDELPYLNAVLKVSSCVVRIK